MRSRRRRTCRRIAAGLLLAFPALSCSENPVLESFDLPRHELLFAHHADAARRDYDIWRMCGDGTQMASLVTAPDQQLQIAISPDGEEFLYTSRADGQTDIWRQSFDGGEAVNLTDHPARDTQPAWGPGGGRIAFFTDRDGGKPELYLLDLRDGSLQRRTENEFHDSGAAWSPDGTFLLFTRYFPRPEEGEHAGDGELIRLDLASGEERQVTRLGGYNGGVSFAPDGKTVGFHRVAEGRSEIWLMAPDGSGAHALTDTAIDEYTPQWSPDGNWIAFTAGVGNDSMGTFDIWLMRPDGTQRQVLNRAANTQGWQRWRPGAHHCR